MIAGENEPATKGDLKTAIGELRTEIKADIAGLDGKIDRAESGLKVDISRLAVEVGRTNARMEKMEDRLSSLIREESAKNTGRIDAFLNRIDTYDRETVRFPRVLDEHGKKLRDHETRIAAIESSRPA